MQAPLAESLEKHDGFLPAGNDIFSGCMSIRDAQAYCQQTDQCYGFTYRLVDLGSDPDGPLDIWFKGWSSNVQPSPDWVSYIKPTQPIPDPEVADLPRFEVGSQEALQYLHTHGYVIYSDVASREEVEHAKDLMWEFFETVPGFPMYREKVETWDGWIGHGASGIVQGYGAGQSAFMWYCRGLPNVVRCFEDVWGTNDLLTSFDGFGFFRPWHLNREWKTNAGWYHVDQSVFKQGCHSVQAFLTLTDNDASTGGLCLFPGTHADHEGLAQCVRAHPKDYVLVPHHHPPLQTAAPVLVSCRAGDLVLWDSRTVHCNTPALVEPTSPVTEPLRAVAYICMTPRSKASREVLEERKKAVVMRVTTTHWPHEFIPVHAPMVPNPAALAQLTPKQQELV